MTLKARVKAGRLVVDEPTELRGHREPGLAHALAHEIPSADSIDLLCAFVRWHGLRLLADPLEALCPPDAFARARPSYRCRSKLCRTEQPDDRLRHRISQGGATRLPPGRLMDGPRFAVH